MSHNISYEEWLQDEEWQKKRLRILRRDNFCCKICASKEELNVHHRYYIHKYLPWEYPDSALVTLCQSCHEMVHETMAPLIYIVKDLSLIRMKFTPCKRCGGYGYLREFKHVKNGVCFRCNGNKYEELIDTDKLININNYIYPEKQAYDTLEFLSDDELGRYHKEGFYYHKTNHKSAIKKYKVAAIHGYAKSQNNLGRLYEEMGDIEQAKRWYLYSAMNGILEAKRNLAILISKEDDEDLWSKWDNLLKDDLDYLYSLASRNILRYFENLKTKQLDKSDLYLLYATYQILKKLESEDYKYAYKIRDFLENSGFWDAILKIDEGKLSD